MLSKFLFWITQEECERTAKVSVSHGMRQESTSGLWLSKSSGRSKVNKYKLSISTSADLHTHTHTHTHTHVRTPQISTFENDLTHTHTALGRKMSQKHNITTNTTKSTHQHIILNILSYHSKTIITRWIHTEKVSWIYRVTLVNTHTGSAGIKWALWTLQLALTELK